MVRKSMVFAVLAMLVAAPALAVTATTNVNMNMPSLVILYYRGTVTFDVADTDLAGAMLAGGNPNDEGAVVINGFGGDAGVTGADYAAASATATVTNFWGVRSIAPGGQNTRVTVSIAAANLSNGVDTITMSNPLTDLAGVLGFGADNVSFAPTGMALQLGDVRFDVDMSAMASPGNYMGGQIDIEAVNI